VGPGGTGGSFTQRLTSGRPGTAFARPGNGLRPNTYSEKVRASRRPGLFDTPVQPSFDSLPPKPPEPTLAETGDTPTGYESNTPTGYKASHPTAGMASGEKSKARDILAAIRTLQAIEQDQRPATAEEKQILARFAGFGPVALSIFPNPVTGNYKDAGWETIGQELKTLLTPAEYDSAKQTTFNAFYTSPTVISSIHEAI